MSFSTPPPREEEATYVVRADGSDSGASRFEREEECVEVRVTWGHTVLFVGAKAAHEPFRLAADGSGDFLLAEEDLGAPSFTLFDGSAAHLPEGAYFEGERFQSADFEAAAPALQQVGREMVTIRKGEWRFDLTRVRAMEKIATSHAIDRRPIAYVAGVMALAGIFLTIVALSPPRSSALSIRDFSSNPRMAEYLLEAQERIEEHEEAPTIAESGAESGASAPDDRGAMGDRESPDRDRRFAVEGNARPEETRLSREELRAQTTRAGVLGTLAQMQWNGPSSPFSNETAIGSDPMAALGALTGATIGDSFGYGGLSLNGTGRGGGCIGPNCGVVGLGELGTFATCDSGHTCQGSGNGYGRATGPLRGRSAAAGPTLRPGRVDAHGGLSREVIQREVRRHTAEIRFCYEEALRSRPDLEGRVSTRFIISPTGAVSTSLIESSSLSHQGAEQCIAQAIRRWTFPQPEGGGVVSVSYPFQLRSN